MSRYSEDLNDERLEELLLNFEGYLVVAFLSHCSIPCDHFRPEFKSLAVALSGRAKDGSDSETKLARLDVDENPAITEALKVFAIPATVVYLEGREVKRFEGPYSREALEERIRAIIGRPL